MDKLDQQIKQTTNEIKEALVTINFEGLSDKKEELVTKSQAADFWKNNLEAQSVMQEISRLDKRLSPWQKLKSSADELTDLASLKDPELLGELEKLETSVRHQFDQLKSELRFSGPYDDHNAILSIFAGAGGTDAQDWTQILFRMYSRFAEKNGYEIAVIDQSPGEEAGLKSITIEIDGPYAFAKLKGEHGVHRLVRLSPFNADNLRQTSFAKVELLPKIEQPDELVLDEKDLKIDVYRAGGHGGQSVNTTDSAVRITHLPTGLNVAIQNERSQQRNKETALTILRSKLVQLELEQHTEKLSELKGPNMSAEWGNQIRSYVLHPYKLVKDLRTGYEDSDPEKVLDGNIDGFINAYLEKSLGQKSLQQDDTI